MLNLRIDVLAQAVSNDTKRHRMRRNGSEEHLGFRRFPGATIALTMDATFVGDEMVRMVMFDRLPDIHVDPEGG